MTSATTRAWVVCALFSILVSNTAQAQGTGRSLDFDVSVRSAAMGGASNALFRGSDLNHWGNPALLGYRHGVRYERGRTRLVPGLAANVWYTSNFTEIGCGGLGFVFGGEPAGPEGVLLDYGPSTAKDEQGNPIGTFGSFETVESWGFGMSLIETFENLRGVSGPASHGVSRIFDVSVGMNFKSAVIALAPGYPGGVGSTTGNDYGILARVTPIDQMETDWGLPLRLDLSYGWSVLNYTDNTVTFISEDFASPLTRHWRQGFAAGVAVGAPTRNIASPLVRSLARGFLPVVSLTATSDHASIGAGDVVNFETSGWGIEATVANVFAYRWGNYTDRLGDIDAATRGFSWAIPVGTFGGFLHEEAWFPEGGGLEDVHREAYAVWIDPREIVAAFRSHGPDNGMARRNGDERMARAKPPLPRLLAGR